MRTSFQGDLVGIFWTIKCSVKFYKDAVNSEKIVTWSVLLQIFTKASFPNITPVRFVL